MRATAMLLKYQCPKCRGTFQVNAELAGRTLQCARCGQKMEAANPLQALPTAPPKPVEIMPVPKPRRMTDEEREIRDERRAEALREQHGDFVFRYGAVLMVLLAAAAFGLIVWGLTALVLEAIPEHPPR